MQTDRIDVSAIKPSALTNAGLLISTLTSNGEELMDLKLVVQVLKNDKGDFVRCVYSPLD
jgi:hypothetical protein